MIEPEFDDSIAELYGHVCGTDEAGRGPLCGPVCAAAVVLPSGFRLPGLDDSKKVSEKKREKLYDAIIEGALAYGIAFATPAEIDQYNILKASLLAMKRAVDEVCKVMKPDVILVDGNRKTDFGIPALTVVHGDAMSPSIAAASILAKVTRDRIMVELDKQYPGYGLAKHKGYPTAEHMLAVYELGAPDIYRKSFLSFLERDKDKLAAALALKRAGEADEKENETV